MKMIKVTNEVADVSRLKLEKLGLSTKRDVENTIGQFGSGIKFAPISAVRKGMRFVFAGNDKNGQYLLEYAIKDEDGIPCIYYKYEDYEKPSSFTADAGLLSWETSFQIYREVIANAMDESKISGFPWNVEIVDEENIKAEDGKFSVYLSATDEMLKVHKDFDKYFSVNREPLYVYPNGVKIYKPIDDALRVYCKGVLVYSTDDQSNNEIYGLRGLFDYEINSLKLNEERTVKNMYDMENAICKAVVGIDDNEINDDFFNRIMKIIARNFGDQYYEFSQISDTQWRYCYGTAGSLKQSVEKLSPQSVLVNPEKVSDNYIKGVRSLGFEPVVPESLSMFNCLLKAGFPQLEISNDTDLKYEVHKDLMEYPKLLEALKICIAVYPEMYEIENKVVVYIDTDEDETFGFVAGRGADKLIYVEKSFLENSKTTIQRVIGLLIHEYDHYSTGYTDGDFDGRVFRNLADIRLGEITYEHYCCNVI